MCCRVLLCAAVCCRVLPCVAMLQCAAGGYRGLQGVQWVAACGSVGQCVNRCCGVLQCVAVCRSVSQCVAVCCSVKYHGFLASVLHFWSVHV